MERSPAEFRRRFRKMASDPFAFYRGSACLFYADIVHDDDPWADERTSRVWIQGDLHAQNFGTYMNDDGVFVFDVNDYDEAYVGHFTWDVKRLVAGLALLAWQKAISDADISRLIETYVRAYVDQVRQFAAHEGDEKFALTLDTTDGYVRDVLVAAMGGTRIGLLEGMTVVDGPDRRFRDRPGVRRLDDAERAEVEAAYREYLTTIPREKRFGSLTYEVKDIVGASGFGIGSAGLSAYNILVEGNTQALENDVILSMKQGNVAAPSRVVDDARIREYFQHHGHRTAVSRRALQANSDPWLGHTQIGGVGYVVQELSPTRRTWTGAASPSPRTCCRSWTTSAAPPPRCTACPTPTSTTPWSASRSRTPSTPRSARTSPRSSRRWSPSAQYADTVRQDHAYFVDAFRNHEIPGLWAGPSSSGRRADEEEGYVVLALLVRQEGQDAVGGVVQGAGPGGDQGGRQAGDALVDVAHPALDQAVGVEGEGGAGRDRGRHLLVLGRVRGVGHAERQAVREREALRGAVREGQQRRRMPAQASSQRSVAGSHTMHRQVANWAASRSWAMESSRSSTSAGGNSQLARVCAATRSCPIAAAAVTPCPTESPITTATLSPGSGTTSYQSPPTPLAAGR